MNRKLFDYDHFTNTIMVGEHIRDFGCQCQYKYFAVPCASFVGDKSCAKNGDNTSALHLRSHPLMKQKEPRKSGKARSVCSFVTQSQFCQNCSFLSPENFRPFNWFEVRRPIISAKRVFSFSPWALIHGAVDDDIDRWNRACMHACIHGSTFHDVRVSQTSRRAKPSPDYIRLRLKK